MMMQKHNLKCVAEAIESLYQYETIAYMNDHMFTLVRTENRTLDFHLHLESDEVFYIVSGAMQLAFRDKVVELSAGDLMVVPKGVEHRPICTKEVIILLIEKTGTLTNENTGGIYSP